MNAMGVMPQAGIRVRAEAEAAFARAFLSCWWYRREGSSEPRTFLPRFNGVPPQQVQLLRSACLDSLPQAMLADTHPRLLSTHSEADGAFTTWKFRRGAVVMIVMFFLFCSRLCQLRVSKRVLARC